jgi:hypothetical protein
MSRCLSAVLDSYDWKYGREDNLVGKPHDPTATPMTAAKVTAGPTERHDQCS